MRVFPRFALFAVILAMSSPTLLASDQFHADCPLTLVGNSLPASTFTLSPAGAFRSGSQVFVLRGQTVSTFNVTDLGDLQIAREDFVNQMATRETGGGVAFSNGVLFVSGDAGLEIFDLRNVRAGGVPPILMSRTPGLHYRRLAVSGNVLAGLFPATDLPCFPQPSPLPIGVFPNGCSTTIDIINISNLNVPTRSATISTGPQSLNNFISGVNDIAFNFGYLIAVGIQATASFNVNNPSTPFLVGATNQTGTFAVSNGTNLIGIGNDTSVIVDLFNTSGTFTPFLQETLDPSLQIDRANPVVFHPQGTFDEAGSRLIMMADERDPQTLQPARTIAFDVFDFGVPQFVGSNPRVYETVSPIRPDEVKHNPLPVGPLVYTVGELSGIQTWGSCGQMTGRIEIANVSELICGGTNLHGWVTGDEKIANVELFLDAGSLGTTLFANVPRTDVPSRNPVLGWMVPVNLDATPRGVHLLRAVGTDTLGNRRQFASIPLFFPGSPSNCTARRRSAAIHF